jgi:hypothetical protein
MQHHAKAVGHKGTRAQKFDFTKLIGTEAQGFYYTILYIMAIIV